MANVERFSIPADVVRQLARGSISPDRATTAWVPKGLATAALKRQAIRQVIDNIREHKRREQFGQMFALSVLGYLAFAEPFQLQLETSRLLLRETAGRRFDRTIAEFGDRLDGASDPRLTRLGTRLKTFVTLQSLHDSVDATFPSARVALASRPFRHLKSLLAVSNLAFLRHYFAFTGGGRVDSLDYFHSAEDVASAVSTLIAIGNEAAPFGSVDIAFPETGIDVGAAFTQLLRYGAAMSTLAEAEKLVTVLGYTLTTSMHNRMAVTALAPPSPEIEYALRLGNVRRDIGNLSSMLEMARNGEQRIAKSDAIEKVVKNLGDKLGVIRDAGKARERLVLLVPDAPEWLDGISNFGYYEDVLSMERLAQELEVPLKDADGKSPMLGKHLSFERFYKAWCILTFINLVDIELLGQHEDNQTIVRNSLVRVTSASAHREMLGTCGLTGDEADEFIELMFIDVNKLKHVDIQYRPFLTLNPSSFETPEGTRTTPREVIHAPAILSTMNVIPNVQRSHGIRMAQDGAALVSVVQALVERVAPDTRTNVQVKLGEMKTDIDVVAFTGSHLYLFECKHSLTPTGAHEMRDLWADIEKGVSQIERAQQILATRMDTYLNGWFPNVRRGRGINVQVTGCVLCSHRVFSGLQIRGVPVRDLASIALTLGDAVVSRGIREDDGQVHLMRFRLRQTEDPALSDLDEYLAPDPKFFRSLKTHMKQFTAVYRLSDTIALTRETYMGQFDDDSWQASLAGVGAQLLEDEVLAVGPLVPPEDK